PPGVGRSAPSYPALPSAKLPRGATPPPILAGPAGWWGARARAAQYPPPPSFTSPRRCNSIARLNRSATSLTWGACWGRGENKHRITINNAIGKKNAPRVVQPAEVSATQELKKNSAWRRRAYCL